jgi:hypothetical protein
MEWTKAKPDDKQHKKIIKTYKSWRSLDRQLVLSASLGQPLLQGVGPQTRPYGGMGGF